MRLNRIQRYDHIWSSSANAGNTNPGVAPPGFVVMFLNHMTLEERLLLEKQQAIYRWAYEEAKRKVDSDFFWDWVI